MFGLKRNRKAYQTHRVARLVPMPCVPNPVAAEQPVGPVHPPDLANGNTGNASLPPAPVGWNNMGMSDPSSFSDDGTRRVPGEFDVVQRGLLPAIAFRNGMPVVIE